jgi:hypothetical protein
VAKDVSGGLRSNENSSAAEIDLSFKPGSKGRWRKVEDEKRKIVHARDLSEVDE